VTLRFAGGGASAARRLNAIVDALPALALIAGAGSFTAEHQGRHGSRLLATHCAPGSGSPTSSPPACCARSAPETKMTTR
jgi:hypothetical protein